MAESLASSTSTAGLQIPARGDLNSVGLVPSHLPSTSSAQFWTRNLPKITYDVWTYILDRLSEDLHVNSHPSAIRVCYNTLLACLLIAYKDWRSPVRGQLYSLVVLHSRSQANRFKDTIVRDPSLRHLVRALVIGQRVRSSWGLTVLSSTLPGATAGFARDWIPFMRRELTINLPNVSIISFCGEWGNYPPRYQELVSNFKPSITKLHFRTTSGSLQSLVDLVDSLPLLTELHVNIEFVARNDDVEPLGGGPAWSDDTFMIETTSTTRRYKHRSQPTVLVIESGLTRLKNFPPLLLFGRSTTHLTLHWDGECKHYAAAPPATLLFTPTGYVPSVSTLVLVVQYRSRVWSNRAWFHSSFGRWVLSIIEDPVSRNIQSLHLRLWSQTNLLCSGPPVRVSGCFILDELFTPELLAAIGKLSSLKLLNVELPYDTLKSEHENQELWWRTKIVVWLYKRGVKIALKVTVHADAGYYLHSSPATPVRPSKSVPPSVQASSSDPRADDLSRPTSRCANRTIQLPPKLCGMVIHSLRLEDDPIATLMQVSESYKALLACATVCSGWAEFSRTALLSMVVVRSSIQMRLLGRILTARSYLANYVRVLRIEPQASNARDGYIPFGSLVFPRLRSLVFHLDWSYYPQDFVNMVPQLYDSASELYITWDSFGTSGKLARFVRGFGPSLVRLHIAPQLPIRTGTTSEPRALPESLPNDSSMPRDGDVIRLKMLELDLQAGITLLLGQPAAAHTFGYTIENLILHWDGKEVVPDTRWSAENPGFKLVGHTDPYLTSLRNLVLVIEPTDDRSAFCGFEKETKSFASWVGSIMSIIRIASRDKHSAFRSLTLRFWPRGASLESRPRSRDAFLRELAHGISQQPFFWYMHRAEDGLSLELPGHKNDPPDMLDWWRRRIWTCLRRPWKIAGFSSRNITVKLYSMIDTYTPKSSPSASNPIWIPVAEEPPNRPGSPMRLLRPSGPTAQSTD